MTLRAAAQAALDYLNDAHSHRAEEQEVIHQLKTALTETHDALPTFIYVVLSEHEEDGKQFFGPFTSLKAASDFGYDCLEAPWSAVALRSPDSVHRS